jgi:sulfur carrier protein
VRLSVNGRERELPSTVATLEELLAELRYGVPVFVARLNGAVVKPEDYRSARIAEGDELEVFNLVAGG